MYKTGMLKIAPIDCKIEDHYTEENGYGDEKDVRSHIHPMDSKNSNYTMKSGAYLVHSCGEWVIGGPTEIKALIDDLVVACLSLSYPKEIEDLRNNTPASQ